MQFKRVIAVYVALLAATLAVATPVPVELAEDSSIGERRQYCSSIC